MSIPEQFPVTFPKTDTNLTQLQGKLPQSIIESFRAVFRDMFRALQNQQYVMAKVGNDNAALTLFNGVQLQNFANDAAAAAGGVELYHFYRNGSVVMQRVA